MSDNSTISLTDKEKLVLGELTSGVIDNNTVTGNEDFINNELHMTIEEFEQVAYNLNTKVLKLL